MNEDENPIISYKEEDPIIKAIAEQLVMKDSPIIYKKDEVCNTQLHHAVKNNDVRLVKILLASEEIHNTNMVNSINNVGMTPLMIAILNDNYPITQLLLHNHSETNLKNIWGYSCINLASISENLNPELIKTLLPYIKTYNQDVDFLIGIALEKNDSDLCEWIYRNYPEYSTNTITTNSEIIGINSDSM